MHFKQKLAFFVFGCVFVIVGQVLTGLVVPSATAQGGLQDVEFGKIKARSIELRDGPDGAWVHIGAGKKGATMILFSSSEKDSSGRGSVMISAFEGIGSMALGAGPSSDNVLLASTTTKAQMSIERDDTALAEVDVMRNEGGFIKIARPDGTVGVSMRTMPTGGAFYISQPDGTTGVYMDASSTGGTVSVSQPDGTRVASMNAFPSGGAVSVNQPDGTRVASISADENGGLIIVNDKYGEPEAGMGVHDNGDGFVVP